MSQKVNDGNPNANEEAGTDAATPLRNRLKPLPVFSAITALLVLAVLVGAEIYLQSIGFPYDPSALLRPHFISAGDGLLETDRFLSKEIDIGVYHQKFSVKKPAGVFRVALLGGSSVNYLSEAPRLKQRLVEAGVAEKEGLVEVINLGMGGCGSDRAVVSARQILKYDLDAMLVYSGHNEFISQSNSRSYRQPNLLMRSRVAQLCFGNPWHPDPIRFYDDR